MAVKCISYNNNATTVITALVSQIVSSMLKINAQNNYNNNNNNNNNNNKQHQYDALALCVYNCNKTNNSNNNNSNNNGNSNNNNSKNSNIISSYNSNSTTNTNNNRKNNSSNDCNIINYINCSRSNSSNSNINTIIICSINNNNSTIINSNIKQTNSKYINISNIDTRTFHTNNISHSNVHTITTTTTTTTITTTTINANDNINVINCNYNNHNNNTNNNNDTNNCNHLYANNHNNNNNNKNNTNEILNVRFVNINDNSLTVIILLNTMDILTQSDHSATSFDTITTASTFMSYLINGTTTAVTATATTTTRTAPAAALATATATATTITANTININKTNYDIQIDIQLLNNDYLDLTTTLITTYNNETTWMHPSETDIILGIFLSVLIFLSIAGNILVCVAIYTERSLRRIGNLFLASLAIADLFVASLVMTFAGINDLLGYWIFGADFCDTWVAFDVMCSTASILNLCAISLDRYIHIKDPLRYGRWVTRRVAIITIATIWLLAAFVSFVPISMGLHRPDQPLIVEDNGKRYPTCALDLTPTYAIVSSSISFYFPCVVMIAIYCRLYCYAQKHVKSIKAVTRPGEIAEKQRYKSIRRSKAQQQVQQQHQQKKFKVRNLHSSPYHVSDHKAAITVGVIMGVFLICWVPFFCVNIVAAFCKTCIGGQTFKILSWLGYSNSAFNPIIYSIFNKEFRDAFKRILTTRIPCYCGQNNANMHSHSHSRNSDRYITDYTTKQHVVAINSGHSSAEIEQVSAI